MDFRNHNIKINDVIETFMNVLNIHKHAFIIEWNYSLRMTMSKT